MIQKTLDKKRQEQEKLVDAVEEVKLLMDKDEREDIALISNAFPLSVNQVALETNAENRITNTLSEKYGSGVYTEDEIKQICMAYRLRFLPSTKYRAAIPIEVIQELKSTLKKEGFSYLVEGTSLAYERNLYIMAPADMFDIKSTSSRMRERNARLAEVRRLRQQDPALLIKIDDKRYLFVKEWGKSFSPTRRILGFFTSTVERLSILFFLAWAAFTVGLTKLGLVLFDIMTPKNKVNALDVILISVYGIVCLLFIISWICSAKKGFFMNRFKDEEKGWWRVDASYATEYNWRRT